jgi:hypothetical protein
VQALWEPLEKTHHGKIMGQSPTLSLAARQRQIPLSHSDSSAPIKHVPHRAGLASGFSGALWQHWQKAWARGDFQQIPILGVLLAERLRQDADTGVYREMSDLLRQSDQSLESKAILIDLLGEIATPEALAQLIEIAQAGRDSPLYIAALQAISHIGEHRWDGRFHEELSPDLEATWSNLAIDDSAYAAAIARAMATIGASSGINLLFQALNPSNQEGQVDQYTTEDTLLLKQTTAFATIPEVRNPAAVEILSQWLQENPLGSPEFEVAALALTNVGSPKATEALLDWAKTAPEEGARRVEEWFIRIHDSASVDLLVAEQETLKFESNAVERAFNKVMEQLHSEASLTTTALTGAAGTTAGASGTADVGVEQPGVNSAAAIGSGTLTVTTDRAISTSITDTHGINETSLNLSPTTGRMTSVVQKQGGTESESLFGITATAISPGEAMTLGVSSLLNLQAPENLESTQKSTVPPAEGDGFLLGQ